MFKHWPPRITVTTSKYLPKWLNKQNSKTNLTIQHRVPTTNSFKVFLCNQEWILMVCIPSSLWWCHLWCHPISSCLVNSKTSQEECSHLWWEWVWDKVLMVWWCLHKKIFRNISRAWFSFKLNLCKLSKILWSNNCNSSNSLWRNHCLKLM